MFYQILLSPQVKRCVIVLRVAERRKTKDPSKLGNIRKL